MIHLCFVIDNSLTMGQRPSNGMNLLDCVKSSIESTLRSLSRLGFPSPHEHIHLFCTSAPRSYLSSFEHDESHLYCQLKAITPAIDTDPALTIQTAIEHISRFRILSEAETLKGYRQAFLYEPALILFFSDRMTRRKMQKLAACLESKAGMRSQYQLASYLVGFPSYTQRGQLTEEGFRGTLEGQKEIRLYGEALRKINSELKFVMSYDGLTASLWNRIETFKPSLLFHFQLKEIKRKLPQFVPSDRGAAYFKAWQDFLNNVPFQLVPTKLWKIPLPYSIKCSDDPERRMEGFGSFRFFLDLNKRYVQANSTIMPQNRYKILPNPATTILENDSIDQKFPIFFEYKGVQCPIGLLCLSPKATQACFFFGNFQTLNSILKVIESKQISKGFQNVIYQYLQSIPHFYHKFLKIIFDKLNLNIDYDHFENPLANTPSLALQSQLESMRLMEKRNLPKIFQANLQNHQKYRAECCPTYSSNPYNFHQEDSLPDVQSYFGQLIGQLLTFKKKAGIEDYLSSNQIDPVPMIKQMEKYNNLKKIGQDDFNQNITINFGNPYRKKRKTNDNEQKEAIIAKEPFEMTPQSPKNNETILEAENIVIQTKPKHEAQMKSKSKNVVPQQERQQRKREKIKESPTYEAQRKPRGSTETKKSSISEPIVEVTDETVRRINSLPLNKEMELKFNPVNLATNSLIRNQAIMGKFMEKWRKN